MIQTALNSLNIDTQTENFLAGKSCNTQNFEKVFNNKIDDNKVKKNNLTTEISQTITQELNDTVQEVLQEGALDLSLSNKTEEANESQIGEELMNYDTTLSTIENSIPQIILADNSTSNSYNNPEESQIELEVKTDSFNLSKNITEDSELLENKPEETEDTVSETKTLKDLIDEETLEKLNVESIESETGFAGQGGNESDLMSNQTPQEQGLKAILHIENEPKTEFKTIETAQSKPLENSSEILKQITKQIENLQNNSRLNIVLNPETLGKVSLQMINTKEGLSAQFTVSSQEARDIIMKGLDNLKNSLASQGVNVNNVTVKLNETQNTEYNADWTEQEGSRGGNKEQKGSNRNQKEQEHFEQTMFTAQNNNENGKV